MISLGELKAGAIRARWGIEKQSEFDERLRQYAIVAVDAAVAVTYAVLKARCEQLGRSKSSNDLWIAATARREGIALATLDHDFDDMPGVTVIGEDGSEVVVPD